MDFNRVLRILSDFLGDIRVLRELRKSRIEDALVDVNRLLAPNWTLAAAAARPTFENCPPFDLC